MELNKEVQKKTIEIITYDIDIGMDKQTCGIYKGTLAK